MIKTWRERITIGQLPADQLRMVPWNLQQDATARITQVVMAALLAVSEGHYRRIETGRHRGVSTQTVARMASVLRLNHAETGALYVWCGHHPPPRRRRHGVPPAAVPEQLLTLMHSVQHGAYWSDETYAVLAANRRAEWHWPWMQHPEGANVMRELLAPRGATQGRRQCHQWAIHWAPHLVAQLRRAAIAEPEHACLRGLAAEVRQHQEVRQLWDSDERAELVHHAYGTIRPMRGMALYGRDRVVSLAIEALVPPSRPDLRLVVGVPTEDAEPPLQAGPPPPPVIAGVERSP